MVDEKIRNCFDEMVVYKDLKKSNFFNALSLPSFMRDWILKKFEDEEGNEYSYSVVDYLFYNGEEYALMTEVTDEEPENGQQECIVCKIVAETDEDGEENESFELVEDESLGQKLVEIFNTKLAEEEKEDE